ncbi:MAG TPA: ferritin-like domain-containing protein [Candidatus Binatia bacterium]|nr:ferritin-like domain-containing protein [Candidatus Binatia bacterium]
MLLARPPALGERPEGPTRAKLETLLREEASHLAMLARAFARLGADPTAQTPAADVAAVESSGVLKVIDPRTDLAQSLDALLVAELTDNDGWWLLIDLARTLGHDELANEFGRALAEEERHLAQVRGRVAATTLAEARASAG